ncbi:PREDICTED: uncharacterized protein LOC107195087 [Dufourea novaeangliae]|uniref:Uncharacterized protein n=1 Tax=Dufourea novaeangliae TaxID=178035 RepID=A0A154P4K4_DUFNO|nr:PREDICTED: uncharacterized protein LOC107195087 [Dufourea novaeangliae]KZC06783.1 hypothetical protein WN55_07915 [Dufourea novaeangliae]
MSAISSSKKKVLRKDRVLRQENLVLRIVRTLSLRSFEHALPLYPDVQKHLLPMYQYLWKKDLLERCVGGHTQNANESFNSTVWRLAPKHLNYGINIIEIATFIAASIFNEGYCAILKMMNILEIKIGHECKYFPDKYNAARVHRQERLSRSSSKEARSARREEQLEQQQFLEEGLLYGPVIAD